MISTSVGNVGCRRYICESLHDFVVIASTKCLCLFWICHIQRVGDLAK
jgi:hypothetical protein